MSISGWRGRLSGLRNRCLSHQHPEVQRGLRVMRKAGSLGRASKDGRVTDRLNGSGSCSNIADQKLCNLGKRTRKDALLNPQQYDSTHRGHG